MNPVAYSALMWTRQQLSDEQKKWLRRAPFQRILPNEIVLVHATQDKPNSWAYVTNVDTATHSINMLRDNQFLCFNGHTHVPRTFIRHEGSIQEYESGDIQLLKTNKYLINVGSVGQPRDGDPAQPTAFWIRTVWFITSAAWNTTWRKPSGAFWRPDCRTCWRADWGKEYSPPRTAAGHQGRKPEIRRHFGGFLYSPCRNRENVESHMLGKAHKQGLRLASHATNQ